MTPVPLGTATRIWFAISLQTFGGPAGQIAVMQRVLVDEKQWIDQQRFLHALNYCMLLPGPEAQQLAIYIGWLLNGIRGGLIAGTLFVLPGFIALLSLSMIYVRFGDTDGVSAIFGGLAAAVLAIVAQAVSRLTRKALPGRAHLLIAGASFLAIAVFAVPFPVIVGTAALTGWLLFRNADTASDTPRRSVRPAQGRPIFILVIGLLLWAAPLVAVVVLTGTESVFTAQGLFFSGAALVTFGGAYAVLSYVAQQAVYEYGWLSPGDMVRGLALAESTPGPLIMVVQFVAFLGAYHHPGQLNPWVAGVLASLLTVWVTFVPCFLFIFLGAPYVESLRGNRSLTAALGGITAAVVGVIANLALYFAVHTLFAADKVTRWGPVQIGLPDVTTFRPLATALTAIAVILLFSLRWPVPRVLAICAVLGLAAALAGAHVT